MEKLSDLFQAALTAQTGAVKTIGQSRHRPGLLPNRHPVRDFFIADILDWALKDDRHSMEHPFSSLSKKPDLKARHYEHNGNKITIKPSSDGLATIWDKDILIYDMLVNTNRHTGGGDYDQLQKAFERLSGTRITTDIRTNGIRQREGFGIIDAWKIIEKHPVKGRMVAIELRLSDWLYNAILGREVLTLSRDYFRLSGGLERRIYELARKHCGRQAKWHISLELLHKKSGSSGSVREFRRKVKEIVEADVLPDYHLRYESDTDAVLFYSKEPQKLITSLAETSGF